MENASLEHGYVSNSQEVGSGECENSSDKDPENGKAKERFSIAMSWWIEFRVERPTFSVPRISNQREERARSSDENAISSKSHS